MIEIDHDEIVFSYYGVDKSWKCRITNVNWDQHYDVIYEDKKDMYNHRTSDVC